MAQIILFNTQKKTGVDQNKSRHSLDCEPTIPVYLGLNIHMLVRSKKLIDQLNELCISISYDRVLQFENTMAHSMCQQFHVDNIVCPSHLHQGLFTSGALDNVDQNPFSTTAQSAFHGTAISLLQFPTKDNIGICREPLTFDKRVTVKDPVLPQSYSTVPTVALNAALNSVPKRCLMVHWTGQT